MEKTASTQKAQLTGDPRCTARQQPDEEDNHGIRDSGGGIDLETAEMDW
jgi:hypothetical protein